MQQRFVSIWFRCLKTDWIARRRPALKDAAFVMAAPDHGRMVITASNLFALKEGAFPGTTVADARAMIPALEVLDDEPDLPVKLLSGIAEWCIRYTPAVAIALPDGLILNVSGCAHLWGGEEKYLQDIVTRLQKFGYHVRAAIADTIGAAWGVARFALKDFIVETGGQKHALLSLPAAALRIETETADRLNKLGLRQISQFISMPRPALRRRFGTHLLQQLDRALGTAEECIELIHPLDPYRETLPCMEPIVTAAGIEIALERLLDALCARMTNEQKGLRTAALKCYRDDGKIEMISIGTNRANSNRKHLFKLFAEKIESIEPASGIDLFILEASKVEDVPAMQESLWRTAGGLNDTALSELLDRIGSKTGPETIHRFLPDEHYWPERSFKTAIDVNEKIQSTWKAGRPRPLQLLAKPELIEVTAPVPDYPPMLFRYRGQLHKIAKADGPERIEQEWWLQDGRHRDYYYVEDEAGCRYWLFRSGHYDAERSYQWFLHGFFA